MQHQILINVITFVAYVLNLPLNTQRSHPRSQRAAKWSLILAHDRRPIYRAPTYIAVPLLGLHQPRYIGLTLYQNSKCGRKKARLAHCWKLEWDIFISRANRGQYRGWTPGGGLANEVYASPAGLAIILHNYIASSVILKAKMSYGTLSPCNAKSMGQIWKLWDIFSDHFIT